MNEHTKAKGAITVSVAEAKAHFSELLKKAEAGETVRVTRHGKVVAEITGSGLAEKMPLWGSAKGKVWISPDFDEPLEDFAEYM